MLSGEAEFERNGAELGGADLYSLANFSDLPAARIFSMSAPPLRSVLIKILGILNPG